MLFMKLQKQANAPVPQVSFDFAVSQNGRATPESSNSGMNACLNVQI